MKRDLLEQLQNWKTHPLRYPLVLRGARQVGKSWLVDEFGKSFEHIVKLNLEKDKAAATLFTETINIPALIQKIRYYTETPIEPGKTLLFIDEIQESENALRTLRYFKEDFPQLHVIAAGSLLDFVIEKIGMPVGRVQFLHLYPLSFAEFLTAINRDDLRTMLLDENPTGVIHDKLLEFVKLYSLTGGMPAVVSAWLDYENAYYCQEIQDTIIHTYQQDFNKYARSAQIEYVTTLFERIPDQLGKKFKYSEVDEHISIHHLKQALQLLRKAGIAYYCYHSSAQGLPLGASKNYKKFKVFFFDIGLAQRILGTQIKDWVIQSALPQHNGAMAEQFVAQQLIAHSNPTAPAELSYWHREARNSNAEVDFLIIKNGKIIPIEVKSGIKGKYRSLQLFLDYHPQSPFGVIISSGEYRERMDGYFSFPFYSLESLLSVNLEEIKQE